MNGFISDCDSHIYNFRFSFQTQWIDPPNRIAHSVQIVITPIRESRRVRRCPSSGFWIVVSKIKYEPIDFFNKRFPGEKALLESFAIGAGDEALFPDAEGASLWVGHGHLPVSKCSSFTKACPPRIARPSPSHAKVSAGPPALLATSWPSALYNNSVVVSPFSTRVTLSPY